MNDFPCNRPAAKSFIHLLISNMIAATMIGWIEDWAFR